MKYLMKNTGTSFWIAWVLAVMMTITFRINKSIINTNQFNPLKLWQEQIQHTTKKSTYQL